MRRAGSARPEAISAERTRSRASETALSARPTTWKAGSPCETWTCTSTARASIPSKATVETRATIPGPNCDLSRVAELDERSKNIKGTEVDQYRLDWKGGRRGSFHAHVVNDLAAARDQSFP